MSREVAGGLGLRVDADLATQLAGQPGPELEDLVEGRHREAPVVDGVALPQQGDALRGAQRPQLGQGQVLDEPAGAALAVDDLRCAPVGELRVVGDVGGAADLRLVPGHQHPVGRGDQVRLDEVGAHPGGQLVAGEGVLGALTGRAAVRDEQRGTSIGGSPVSVARPHGSIVAGPGNGIEPCA